MRALLVVSALAAALVVACATAAPLPAGPGEEGAVRLYRSRCAACHRLYAPEAHTAGEWRAAVDRMAPRAHLAPDEKATLERYLVAHAAVAR